MSEKYLKPLPEDSSFIINIVTNHSAHVTLTENADSLDFPWIVDENFKEVENGEILPVKDVNTDYLNLQLYVIEDKNLKI